MRKLYFSKSLCLFKSLIRFLPCGWILTDTELVSAVVFGSHTTTVEFLEGVSHGLAEHLAYGKSDSNHLWCTLAHTVSSCMTKEARS